MKKLLLLFTLIGATLSCQAGTTPSYPNVSSVTDADLFLDWQSGAQKNATGAQIKAYILDGGSLNIPLVTSGTGTLTLTGSNATVVFGAGGTVLYTSNIGSTVQAFNSSLAAISGGTWTGATSITTLGTITAGTWHGAAIANAYLANSALTVSGHAISLGGSYSLVAADVSGLGSLATLTPGAGAGTALGIAVNTSGGVLTVGGGLYESPLTFSTGLTRSGNTITVNSSQNISTLSNLIADGFVTTSGGTGSLSSGWTVAPASSSSSGQSVQVTGGATTTSTSFLSAGNVSIFGGSYNGSSNGQGGAVFLDGGSKGSGSQAGGIFIGSTTSTAIQIGRSGAVTSLYGTNTTGNATPGCVGELVQSAIASGSAVSLTTATTANVTSISLTAGDWDVSGNVNFTGTTATVTGGQAGISTTSATLPTDGTECYDGTITTALSDTSTVTLPRKRISINSTTTVYLEAQKTFSAGTEAAFGSITARRVR